MFPPNEQAAYSSTLSAPPVFFHSGFSPGAEQLITPVVETPPDLGSSSLVTFIGNSPGARRLLTPRVAVLATPPDLGSSSLVTFIGNSPGAEQLLAPREP